MSSLLISPWSLVQFSDLETKKSKGKEDPANDDANVNLVVHHTRNLIFVFATIVFDAQTSLKNQKMALLVVLRVAFLGGIGTLLFNEFGTF